MLIIPAVDIKDGKAVRLWQGDFNKVTEYSDKPHDAALRWQEEGAEFLHVVDLDGAFSGKLANFECIRQIAENINIPFEVGGGVRDKETIGRLLDLGAMRVVLGTKALENREFIKSVISEFKDAVAVSIDARVIGDDGAARGGMVAGSGWTDISGVDALSFALELEQLGLNTLIYTDISRDGTLQGPNVAAIAEILNRINIDLIASGGISSLDDIKELSSLKGKELAGIIIGKALYENKFSLKDAMEAAG
ncbi:MAG: 1-(5-phosphoribosyl)-5-[(5-phosphoribosylamino)methylideneamino]imidazole-4-carboxamide isomerase [Candidatus Omnitrophica bacterium CG11_big_fil_rev_8_21_14_0_20_42_13]|uniref:1-(5-phosphoribosyl)-5-[(5-phosphoribosylamino)methylideneamino] imidazole-4-carboxamide isomerase n=1 Tax=Candidatus Ghiorseimicrobium undicola TaxID=1974746 RepID=A0A2H0LVH4_9BACT|nr:MAG: 1-(5-phosphoribosyl)-5-[(5-phosphoribosylamino)methylideneamino]imidazole-4-carboxamide isomerase [Candidatus Omnitrophica bacterium CG11_big_fil_rev_8_21_14_0_20_42_13]